MVFSRLVNYFAIVLLSFPNRSWSWQDAFPRCRAVLQTAVLLLDKSDDFAVNLV